MPSLLGRGSQLFGRGRAQAQPKQRSELRSTNHLTSTAVYEAVVVPSSLGEVFSLFGMGGRAQAEPKQRKAPLYQSHGVRGCCGAELARQGVSALRHARKSKAEPKQRAAPLYQKKGLAEPLQQVRGRCGALVMSMPPSMRANSSTRPSRSSASTWDSVLLSVLSLLTR